jgi:hypothetical protein
MDVRFTPLGTNTVDQPEPTEAAPAISASISTSAKPMKPLVVSVPEFRRLAGNIGKTLAFALMKSAQVERVKIRGRTGVTLDSIERLIARSTTRAHD